MKVYEQIDKVVESITPESLASYIMGNYEQYGLDLAEHIRFIDMENHYAEQCCNQQTTIFDEEGNMLY